MTVARKIVDMSTDPRRAHYAFFRNVSNPWFGLTVQLDITDFLQTTKGEPFFHSFLYVVTRAFNAVPELRRRFLPDGTVVEYDRCSPSYTASKPDHTFAFCLVDCDTDSRAEFIKESIRRQEAAIRTEVLEDEGDALEHFFVSSLPWISYTQVTVPSGPDGECNPRFEWGKYYEQNGRVLLPFTIFVHHALADGWHVSQFFERLQEEMNAIK